MLILHDYYVTVNQQILAGIKFGISQNKVIWRLLNFASPRGPSMQCTIDVYVGGCHALVDATLVRGQEVAKVLRVSTKIR